MLSTFGGLSVGGDRRDGGEDGPPRLGLENFPPRPRAEDDMIVLGGCAYEPRAGRSCTAR